MSEDTVIMVCECCQQPTPIVDRFERCGSTDPHLQEPCCNCANNVKEDCKYPCAFCKWLYEGVTNDNAV